MNNKLLRAATLLLILSAALSGCAADAEETTAGSANESATESAAETIEETEAIETSETSTLEAGVYINGRLVELEDDSTVDLDLLSVENGITVTVVKEDDEQVLVNGEEVESTLSLDITAITREDVLEIEVTDEEDTLTCTVNLMPSDFGDFTTEGESQTGGDYYLSTYDEDTNYIFKLDSSGNLIFYKETGDNALDFRKVYNSDGEVRYTYLQYLENSFCGISGINPGCVVVMDENYDVIDELYYQTEDGEDRMVDPHGFIYLDDGHYILTSYVDEVVEDIPEDLEATDNSAYLAVLYVQEIQDGEVLWEFCSRDYESFLYATTAVTWSESTDSCYDYMHFNSMYIDEDDHLLISCRNINSILKLSRETGELVWILGGTEDEFGLTDDQLFSKQHSIIVTADGSYMIFNNANDEVSAGTTESSSIIRLKVDESTMEVTEYTEYETDFYSNYMGSIRELDSEEGIYLWAVGGNYSGEIPEYSMVEYSETDGVLFTFRFDEGSRKLYCANKCE
ncbi:MAG: aryl-sulfate sulfotransferase [Lachnospiraceae bacterium]|nr:aryl-sulfate sulfotransferase [Lachnospiraceae bacterium]